MGGHDITIMINNLAARWIQIRHIAAWNAGDAGRCASELHRASFHPDASLLTFPCVSVLGVLARMTLAGGAVMAADSPQLASGQRCGMCPEKLGRFGRARRGNSKDARCSMAFTAGVTMLCVCSKV